MPKSLWYRVKPPTLLKMSSEEVKPVLGPSEEFPSSQYGSSYGSLYQYLSCDEDQQNNRESKIENDQFLSFGEETSEFTATNLLALEAQVPCLLRAYPVSLVENAELIPSQETLVLHFLPV